MITAIPIRKAEIMPHQWVSRALPSRRCPRISAWCFLDYLHQEKNNESNEHFGINVAPHPHIGLQTFTWMRQGSIVHEDSLGNHSVINPHEVHLMTAGRGIVHTEVSPNFLDKAKEINLTEIESLQFWLALPKEKEAIPPTFKRYPHLPHFEHQGLAIHLFMGEFLNHNANIPSHVPLMGADITVSTTETKTETHTLPLNKEFEYGIFLTHGKLNINQDTYEAHQFLVLDKALTELSFTAEKGSKFILIGGSPVTEPIMMWWNFIAHDQQTIEEAMNDWEHYPSSRFGKVNHPEPAIPAPPLTANLKVR